MSIDWANEKMTHRAKLLKFLWDMDWHPNWELADVAGNRYAARILELRREGYQIETENLADKKRGKKYRLMSRDKGEPLGKRVKVFLEEDDVIHLLSGGSLSGGMKTAMQDALNSFQSNKGKL